MQVPYHRLMPTQPFFRVTQGSTTPIRQVRLPVTFGTRDNYRTDSLDLASAGVKIPLARGRPNMAGLSKTKAAPIILRRSHRSGGLRQALHLMSNPQRGVDG
jgi:hypothetical protein